MTVWSGELRFAAETTASFGLKSFASGVVGSGVRSSETCAQISVMRLAARPTAELSGHVAECAGCAETARVTRALLTIREVEVPDAGVVWLRVQARAEEETLLRRAMRPLAVMRVLSAVFVVALAVWSAPMAWALLLSHLPGVGDLTNLGTLGTDGIAGAVVSVVLVGVGVWGLWYVGRRTPSPVLKY